MTKVMKRKEERFLQNSRRALNDQYWEKLVTKVVLRTGNKWFVPYPIRSVINDIETFSCALKLAMPIAVLSAIREASLYQVTVKGGKYLEAMAEADTIVFDKTGTLTKAQPTVAKVISFNGENPDELLRIAACLEEHFPHSMAFPQP